MLLFDVPTGEPRALVNASAVTEIRTAATSAVATDLLARPGAAEVAIIGTGVQGRAHAHAIAATRELTGIRLAGRDPARTRAVAAELTGQLDVPVSAYDDVAAAVAGAAIVVTATSSAEPVLRREWLAPGAHVNAVGACVPGARELDTATMAEAAVFADSRESVSNEAGDFLIARARRAWPTRSGPNSASCSPAPPPGARMTDEITVFESLGLAAEDLAAASFLYEKAARLGCRDRRRLLARSLEKSGDRGRIRPGLRYRGR